jgi:hypothetical protein
MPEIHPLDRDENEDGSPKESTFDFSSSQPGFDYTSPQSGQIPGPNRQILKYSVRAIIGFGILVFFSTVTLSNMTYGTAEYQTAFVISRVLISLLLLSFMGVLLAFQWSNIIGKLNQMGGNQTLSGFGSSSLTMKEVNPLSWLFSICAVVVALAWTVTLLASSMPQAVSMILSAIATLLPGMLITMIVWNKGCVRAFAIGALVSFALGAFSMLQTVMFMQMGRNQFGQSGQGLGILIGLQWTITAVGGLIPATYVWFLEKLRSQKLMSQREAAASAKQWKPGESSMDLNVSKTIE